MLITSLIVSFCAGTAIAAAVKPRTMSRLFYTLDDGTSMDCVLDKNARPGDNVCSFMSTTEAPALTNAGAHTMPEATTMVMPRAAFPLVEAARVKEARMERKFGREQSISCSGIDTSGTSRSCPPAGITAMPVPSSSTVVDQPSNCSTCLKTIVRTTEACSANGTMSNCSEMPRTVIMTPVIVTIYSPLPTHHPSACIGYGTTINGIATFACPPAATSASSYASMGFFNRTNSTYLTPVLGASQTFAKPIGPSSIIDNPTFESGPATQAESGGAGDIIPVIAALLAAVGVALVVL